MIRDINESIINNKKDNLVNKSIKESRGIIKSVNRFGEQEKPNKKVVNNNLVNFSLLQTKKGGTKLLTIWWFFVIVLVVVGISAGAIMFYSQKIDVRQAEANILVKNTISCLIENGHFNESLLLKENFFKYCNLKEEIIDKSSDYIIKISLESSRIAGDTYFGNRALEEECKIKSAVSNAKNYPSCASISVFALIDNEIQKINIMAGSNYEYS
jgi:hypothetical protein